MNKYFDLHMHPVFKKFLTEYEEVLPTERVVEELTNRLQFTHLPLKKLDKHLLHILGSQSNIDALVKGGVTLGVAAIAAIEFGFADAKGLPAKALFSDYLTHPIDQDYFKKVKRGEVSYFNLFLRELDLYRKLGREEVIDFVIPESNEEQPQQKGKINLLIGIEGGHNLSLYKVANEEEIDRLLEFKAQAEATGDAFYHPFVALAAKDQFNPEEVLLALRKALDKEGMAILYVTLTHLTFIREQHLATHAYGMKLLKHAAFSPFDNGLSAKGKRVIDAAYKEHDPANNKCGVLIDIKHMSLKSRQDFYAYRQEMGYTDIPIIASHMGVTGYSTDEWKEAVVEDEIYRVTNQGLRVIELKTKRKDAGKWGAAFNNKFTYNPWSINLMDDDIVEVVKSNGLIGISLDVRVLGFKSKVEILPVKPQEYFSIPEFSHHFPDFELNFVPSITQEAYIEDESYWFPDKEDRHPLCLCFNIIHTLVVIETEMEVNAALSEKNQKQAHEYLCIGSDFDGLINPLKICPDSSRFQNLEKKLIKWLPIAAKAYHKENGGPDYFYTNFNDSNMLKKIIRDILYNNGRRFLKDLGYEV